MKKRIIPAAIPRAFSAAVLACAMFGCSTAAQIKDAYPYLSEQRASYFSIRLPWFSSWYRLYSVLPGSTDSNCKHVARYHLDAANRSLIIRNCSKATEKEAVDFGRKLDMALDKIEQRFDHRIRITHASYTLVLPHQKYLERDTQVMRSDNLSFSIAVRDSSTQRAESEINAVRSTAHELYHMGMAATGLTGVGNEPAEEVRASLFASCVEMDVYGKLSADTLDTTMQTDPTPFKGQGSAFDSTTGNLDASRTLLGIAGSDLKISSPSEIGQFARLCNGLAP